MHFALGGILAIPIATFVLKHEPVSARLQLATSSASVQISVVNVSNFDRWTTPRQSRAITKTDNHSAFGTAGLLPATRIGTITVRAWDHTFTLPGDMVRDCFGPGQGADDWKFRASSDGLYIGTIVGEGEGRTLIWWRLGVDQHVVRWVFPMQEHRDLSSLPRPTDVPLETKKLTTFDD